MHQLLFTVIVIGLFGICLSCGSGPGEGQRVVSPTASQDDVSGPQPERSQWEKCHDVWMSGLWNRASAGDRGCYFIEKDPYPDPENRPNLVRIARNEEDGFYLLEDYEIHTDGIIEIEFINNTKEEQGYSPSDLACGPKHVYITGVNDDIRLKWGTHIDERSFAIKPGKVVRTRFDFRNSGGIHLWGGSDLWPLEDGCYNAKLQIQFLPVKGNLRICYTGAEKVSITEPKSKRCAELNSPMIAPMRDTRPLSEIEWPYAEPAEQLSNVEVTDDSRRTPLIWAGAHGDMELVRHLLRTGAKVEARSVDGSTALGETLKINRIDIAELLIKNGAIVHQHLFEDVAKVSGSKTIPFMIENLPKKDHDSALAMAVSFGDLELVERLIAEGASMLPSARHGLDPLKEAIRYNRPEMVSLLLGNGATVFATHLAMAASEGNEKILEILIASGFDPNTRDVDNSTGKPYWMRTAMTKVARGPSNKPIELLLKHGADLTTQGFAGETPLIAAADSCSHFNVLFILSKMNKVTQLDLDRVMAHTAANLCFLSARHFLEQGANASSVWGQAALNSASRSGGFNTVRLLLEHGADANKSAPGLKAMGKEEYINKVFTDPQERKKALKEYKELLDAQTTPLLESVSSNRGNNQTMRILLNAGADVTATDSEGQTPLIKAAHVCSLEQVAMLLEAKSDPNASDNEGQTPLMNIIRTKRCYNEDRHHGPKLDLPRYKIIQLLLNAGADKNAKNKEGLTPMDHAKASEDKTVYELLR